MGSTHYAIAGWRGWLRYFVTPDREQTHWEYWKHPCLTWYGWRESWRFWTGRYKETRR